MVTINGPKFMGNTVDGSEIRRENQLSLVVYPIIYSVKHTSKRWLGLGISEPSTVRSPKSQASRVGFFATPTPTDLIPPRYTGGHEWQRFTTFIVIIHLPRLTDQLPIQLSEVVGFPPNWEDTAPKKQVIS